MNKCKYYIILSIIILFSCHENEGYIPNHNSEISNKSYSLFANQLREAYKIKNSYQIAFQLSNLKYKGPLTYKYLKRAIDYDTGTCNKIYYTMMIARDGNFYQNIFKNDTIVFLKAFNYCLSKFGQNEYKNYREDYLLSTPLIKGCSTKVDSSFWDKELITFLKNIYTDDQKYRRLATQDIFSKKSTKYYDNLILKMDSINLHKVDSFLFNKGFPDFEKISPDQHKTIFLVLHHQSEKYIRLKYRSIVEKYYSKNLLYIYDNYTNQ